MNRIYEDFDMRNGFKVLIHGQSSLPGSRMSADDLKAEFRCCVPAV